MTLYGFRVYLRYAGHGLAHTIELRLDYFIYIAMAYIDDDGLRYRCHV